ncbi:MAG TPA: glycerol-3-phosphate 1-O-acyltransferase PlsY [Beijerinckiaceae bacterium]|nr:glycerol-3-phosphate 1-O-acyltransferase PlsY [Beijerinckiaceae bacterium]
MTSLLALGLGYLLGAIPFGLLLTRMAGTEDIRTIGSGNIGATNVLRTGSKGLALATLLCDALKGTAAVMIARHVWGGDEGLLAGLAAFLGHLFPVWLGFKGGKGVATYLGVLLAVSSAAFVVAGLVWLAVAYVTRYSSAGSLTTSAITPLAVWMLATAPAALLFLVMAPLLWWKHSENIQRLRAGTESKIGKT